MFNKDDTNNNVNKFKDLYKKFIEAMQYVNNNRVDLEKDPNKWNVLKENFKIKFEEPLDKAWLELSPDEKHRFNTLYAINRWKAEEDMEEINEMIKIVNGTIVSVTETEKGKGDG